MEEDLSKIAARGDGLERRCLIKIVNAFGVMLCDDSQVGERVQNIKKLANVEGALPVDTLEKELSALKNIVLTQEQRRERRESVREELPVLEGVLVEACESLRKITQEVVENLYPLNKSLQEKASAIRIDCAGEAAGLEFPEATKGLLDFLGGLKTKISEDFSYINRTFLLLLDQVKGLEKSLAGEITGEERLKEIDAFEVRIQREVGSIAHSFDIYSTINEIKGAVLEKIKNIRLAVSLRKKEELKRARAAQENIKKLTGRISEAEKDAREMARRAEEFQMAAMKDGLTGLYNRKALDLKAENALKSFQDGKKPFSLILFDVDDFKEINDSLGHVAGDKVLKKVAECLRQSFREKDFVARYGGDEFVVLIEKLDREIARQKILSFSRNLKKRRFVSYKRGEIDIQVSAGVAAAEPEDTLEDLLERADRAMYASKQNGKTASAKLMQASM